MNCYMLLANPSNKETCANLMFRKFIFLLPFSHSNCLISSLRAVIRESVWCRIWISINQWLLLTKKISNYFIIDSTSVAFVWSLNPYTFIQAPLFLFPCCEFNRSSWLLHYTFSTAHMHISWIYVHSWCGCSYADELITDGASDIKLSQHQCCAFNATYLLNSPMGEGSFKIFRTYESYKCTSMKTYSICIHTNGKIGFFFLALHENSLVKHSTASICPFIVIYKLMCAHQLNLHTPTH